MKKQIIYNFSKLTGDYYSGAGEFGESSRRQSREKVSSYPDGRQSHRIFRPTGIVKVRKDEVSSSRSSIQSASRQTLKLSSKPYVAPQKASDIQNAEQFFRRFNSDYAVKYKSVTMDNKQVKRNLWRELESGSRTTKPISIPTFQLPCLKINEFKSSLVSNSRHSTSRDSLTSNKSHNKLTMKQIEAKYKQSEEKIQKIRQKVNELYRLNTQNSQKQYKSLITRPKSKPRFQHRLLF